MQVYNWTINWYHISYASKIYSNLLEEPYIGNCQTIRNGDKHRYVVGLEKSFVIAEKPYR